MVSPRNPNNSHNLHHFLISDSGSSQSQHLDSFGVCSSYPQSLGGLPYIHSAEESNHQLNHNTHFRPHQTLSLSLDSGILLPPVEYRPRSLTQNTVVDPGYLFSGGETRNVSDYSFNGTASAYDSATALFDRSSSTFYGTEPLYFGLRDSKYLKAAQSLLEELVSISSHEIELSNQKYVTKLSRDGKRGSSRLSFELKAELCRNDLSLERNEIQSTISKLIELLEKVERRFEEYYKCVEAVVLSFEETAGLGRGKCYTARALEAMSRHFCNLRDAIVSQIYANKQKLISQSTRVTLDEPSGNSSRLSLEHLGLLHYPRQTWRPIRGLPQTCVTILRAWLFQHFLHPYPNDSEKITLASQTGLTKNQVSNWFINARVRLWKPMIEEMYKEEFEDSSDE